MLERHIYVPYAVRGGTYLQLDIDMHCTSTVWHDHEFQSTVFIFLRCEFSSWSVSGVRSMIQRTDH